MSLDSSSAISSDTFEAVQHVNKNLIHYIDIYSLQFFLNILFRLKGLFLSHTDFNHLDSNLDRMQHTRIFILNARYFLTF